MLQIESAQERLPAQIDVLTDEVGDHSANLVGSDLGDIVGRPQPQRVYAPDYRPDHGRSAHYNTSPGALC
ncbi:hypothetical protein [Streptomyces sp. NBC_01446]|uniref:hypothetical protein n=1 Tax=Streptomyces sp. NBC_01446 TaxID=2903870 RepID=UPI002257686A|nr:hypothetical protein [Streptomyces sp. NBC_01446]MCX4641490.1 hypothetical protein [Streptomyces sp. NBC_01446]